MTHKFNNIPAVYILLQMFWLGKILILISSLINLKYYYFWIDIWRESVKLKSERIKSIQYFIIFTHYTFNSIFYLSSVMYNNPLFYSTSLVTHIFISPVIWVLAYMEIQMKKLKFFLERWHLCTTPQTITL